MNVNVRQLSPWNWFGKEDAAAGRSLTDPAIHARRPLSRLHEEMDRMFEDFFGGMGWSQPSTVSQSGRALADMPFIRPQLDIVEGEKAYTITVEVPGVSQDDVEVTVQDDMLLITGEKRQADEQKEGRFHRVERAYGQFQRMLTLPADASVENISADFHNGLLTITVPRKEGGQTERGRRIPIGNARQ